MRQLCHEIDLARNTPVFLWSSWQILEFSQVFEKYHLECEDVYNDFNVDFFFQARRFMTLVDELYNHHYQLICSAAGPPDDLFLGTIDGPIIDLERLHFLVIRYRW